MLKPLGGEGAPFKAVGEWLVPLVTVKSTKSERKNKLTEKCTGKLQPSVLPFKYGRSCNLKTVGAFFVKCFDFTGLPQAQVLYN